MPPSDLPYPWKDHNAFNLKGQHGQPEFVNRMYKNALKNGFFIEAGAHDGKAISNSLLFELRYTKYIKTLGT